MAFSPDGRTLAAGSDDTTVRLWNVGGGKSLATLTRHTGPVTSVAFSPDGRTVASGSVDTTIVLWDIRTRKARAALQEFDTVQAVAFSPDGSTLATGNADNVARLRNVMLPPPAAATRRICQAVNGDLTSEERAAYLPDGSDPRVCSGAR